MRAFLKTIGFVFLVLGGSCWAEGLPPLEELKMQALKNSLSLRAKEEELVSLEAQSSLFNNVRAVSSYNFETGATFYGLSLSIPFGFFSSKKKYLRYKRTGLEEAKRGLLDRVEELYSDYELLRKQLEVYEVELKKTELKFMLAKEEFEHDRIEKAELIEAEKAFKEAEFEVFKINQRLKGLKDKLCELAGISDGHAQ